MALHRSSKENRRKATFRKNDKKGFHRSQSMLSTTLVRQSTKSRGNVSIIPSLKANNKQLAAALDEAKQKVRRHEEQILKLQQERLELLERNSKSEICIQSLQSSLPKAEQLLHEADVKMTEAKQSIVRAKEVALECFVRDNNIIDITSGSTCAMKIEQPITFNPILASTPQNSPPANSNVNLACSMFDDAFKDELSISLTEVQASSSSSQDKCDASLQEMMEGSSHDNFQVSSKDLASLPVRTPRPKRHCAELTTSYAEDDLARKFYEQVMEAPSSNMLSSKQRKSQQKLKKKPATALRNITNVI